MQWARQQLRFYFYTTGQLYKLTHPFHVQWTCRQIKFYFSISRPIIETYTPISHAMGLPAAKILFLYHRTTIQTYTSISHAMGLPTNKILILCSKPTIKLIYPLHALGHKIRASLLMQQLHHKTGKLNGLSIKCLNYFKCNGRKRTHRKAPEIER